MDSDDTVDEDSLRGVLKTALLKKPDMLLFGMSFDYYNNGKMYLRETLNPPSEGMLSLQNLKDDFDEFYNCNALTPVWNKLFRSDLLKSAEHVFARTCSLWKIIFSCLSCCRSVKKFIP